MDYQCLAVNDRRPKQYLNLPAVRLNPDVTDGFDAATCYKSICMRLLMQW